MFLKSNKLSRSLTFNETIKNDSLDLHLNQSSMFWPNKTICASCHCLWHLNVAIPNNIFYRWHVYLPELLTMRQSLSKVDFVNWKQWRYHSRFLRIHHFQFTEVNHRNSNCENASLNRSRQNNCIIVVYKLNNYYCMHNCCLGFISILMIYKN